MELFSPHLTSGHLIKKHPLLINQGVQNWFLKQEMELTKQEMELFFHFRACHQKSSFTRCFTFFERSLKSIYITGKKIVWTWNQIISLTSWPRIKNFFHKIFHFHQGVQTRKSNYFSHFLASDQKTSSTAYAPYLPRNSILIVKTGNGIIQTGNGIISPTSRPQIRKKPSVTTSSPY